MIKQPFSNTGVSAIALRYAQMKQGKPVTLKMLVSLSPSRFRYDYDARRCFETLAKYKLVSKVDDDAWTITPKGTEYLRLTAKQYVGEYAKVRK